MWSTLARPPARLIVLINKRVTREINRKNKQYTEENKFDYNTINGCLLFVLSTFPFAASPFLPLSPANERREQSGLKVLLFSLVAFEPSVGIHNEPKMTNPTW
jgi:hypothetical protein